MNTFVQPYIAGTQALVTCPLYDPRSVRANRARFRRDKVPLLDRVNTFYLSTGRWPSRGWILLARGDYNKLNKYATTFQLNIGDPTQANNVGTLQNLSIVQAQCVTRGLAADKDAIYLVEIVDDQWVLHNPWFQTPITSAYNLRAPAYPQTFYPWSMNGGTTWTWTTMLQDMWNQMAAIGGGGQLLGAWPGLPSVPAGTPEGFEFTGVPIWTAFNDIIESLGMTLATDLTKANPYTIVSAGAADAAFTTLQTKYATNLEDDAEEIDTGAGRVPATVKVLFRRRNDIYGTEETVRYDPIFQWESTPYYTVSVNAPVFFIGAVGEGYLWSDFTVRYDMDGNPLAADTAMANTIAQERVTQYFAKIFRQTLGSMTQVYAGALPFVTGSQVDGVKYYQDYIDQGRMGWKTKIVRGFFPPFDDIWTEGIW